MSPGLGDRFEFAAPWLLLVAPVALVLLLLARGRGRRLVRFSSVALLDGLPETWRTRLVVLPGILVAAGVLLASVALARPRLGDERTVVRTEGIAIELVVDVSGSMRALDFTGPDGKPTDRLSAVKSVVRRFVEGGQGLPGRAGDALGLTIFAGYADASCPLTLDHRLLLETLDATQTARAEFEDGTSIGQGLAVALGRLQQAQARSRVAILLTDGVHNDPESDPQEAARVAADLGVKVYTVGMGSSGFAPYPQEDRNGDVHMVRMPVQIDEELLAEIARRTGARYGRAGTTEQLQSIYGEIDRLERTEIEGLTYRRWRELFAWPLGLGALLWCCALLLENTTLRRLG